MQRLLPLLLLLCIFTPAFAQEHGHDDEDRNLVIVGGSTDEFFGRSGTLFEVGYTNVRPWQLNGRLLNHEGFDHLIAIGFASNQAEETDETFIGTDVTYSMHWFLAQEKTVLNADSQNVRYRLKGWELMTSTLAMNLIPNEHVDLVIGIGAYWGNLKLTSENLTEASGKMHYKNPFVAPMFRSELRFNFSFFSVGARFSYRYDITRDNWKRKDDGIDALPGYQFREMQYIAYIGFRFED